MTPKRLSLRHALFLTTALGSLINVAHAQYGCARQFRRRLGGSSRNRDRHGGEDGAFVSRAQRRRSAEAASRHQSVEGDRDAARRRVRHRRSLGQQRAERIPRRARLHAAAARLHHGRCAAGRSAIRQLQRLELVARADQRERVPRRIPVRRRFAGRRFHEQSRRRDRNLFARPLAEHGRGAEPDRGQLLHEPHVPAAGIRRSRRRQRGLSVVPASGPARLGLRRPPARQSGQPQIRPQRCTRQADRLFRLAGQGRAERRLRSITAMPIRATTTRPTHGRSCSRTIRKR